MPSWHLFKGRRFPWHEMTAPTINRVSGVKPVEGDDGGRATAHGVNAEEEARFSLSGDDERTLMGILTAQKCRITKPARGSNRACGQAHIL